MENVQRIAIIGGGPSGLFMFKRLVECKETNFHIDIFEKQQQLGVGMPYGEEGACPEHITNVSGNEIPDLEITLARWIKELPDSFVQQYGVDAEDFNAYKVLPRVLFGQYLASQFASLNKVASGKGIKVACHFGVFISDIVDYPGREKVGVSFHNTTVEFDYVIICSGHNWPLKYEGKIPGYFDSPYPPVKIRLAANFPVALRGSSLTAIDAVRTLARSNGSFYKNNKGALAFRRAAGSKAFKMVLHSRNGLLPAIRFHLEDSHLSKDSVLSKNEIETIRSNHEGFVPLDYIFEKNFKEPLKENDPGFFDLIQNMKLEDFVEAVMNVREKIPPFELFKAEYLEAEKSIRKRESVHWKEMLAVLSFSMNNPAKYFSAEDMLRLQKVLMPLISVVIAFVPQSSVEEMLALHEAGLLDIIAVGDDSRVVPEERGGATYVYTDDSGKQIESPYRMFIDCIGQPHFNAADLPYKSLVTDRTVSGATLPFKDSAKGRGEMQKGNNRVYQNHLGEYCLSVPGITINDYFQVVDENGNVNPRIFMMAVPYIGGFNPDYSGLDFCEAASTHVFEGLKKSLEEWFAKGKSEASTKSLLKSLL